MSECTLDSHLMFLLPPSLFFFCPALSPRAMGGSMPFQDALKARLDLMTPSKDTVARCLREHPPRLSPGAFFVRRLVRVCFVVCFLVLSGRQARAADTKK